MKLKKLAFLLMNIVLAIITIVTLGAINYRIHFGTNLELKILSGPVFIGIIFGTIIGILSIKRTEYLEKRIKEKTKELEHYLSKLEPFASMDDMTNIYNRRIGLEMLENHFNLSKRHKNSLSICFVDINRLKYVNDNFGHATGDKLIKDISDMIKSSIRESDIVSRMGGDEFLIIFPECDADGASKVMKRLTEKIREYNESSQRNYMASVSFGISEFSGCNDRTMEELLVEADNKMYAMKKCMKS